MIYPVDIDILGPGLQVVFGVWVVLLIANVRRTIVSFSSNGQSRVGEKYFQKWNQGRRGDSFETQI